jgi:outer membrane protein assembly factor BamB
VPFGSSVYFWSIEMSIHRMISACCCLAITFVATNPLLADGPLDQVKIKRGIVVLLDLPGTDATALMDSVRESELTLYFQSNDAAQINAVRTAADKAGLLGKRVFAEQGSLDSIHLAENIADCIIVSPTAESQTNDEAILKALRPRASAFVGQREIIKPVPDDIDEWSHPFHGPDNNPQSTDKRVKGDFQTQFLARPRFSPMPEQTVIAGGRVYKAMGHIAHKANQNEMLNTLLCINAYNGTILWKRPNSPGFMIHRNTMIATEDALLMGDHESCKIIDGETGKVRDEITIPKEITDGPVWKWMAHRDGTLYALVGNPEIKVDTMRSARRGLGHWPWGMWKGHDYKDPRTAFGYGRTLVAIDLKTKKIKWHYRDEEFLDARAICMNDTHIFCFCPEKFLLSVEIKTGKVAYKSTDKLLLGALGPNAKAQHYVTGYATTAYIKCDNENVYFAGPQRTKMVVASANEGKLNWTNDQGNLQLILRKDAIYAAGPQRSAGMRLDYKTGNVLSSFPARRACTRATGCEDSIFFRASGGTVRVMTESGTLQHIAPMRPPCQDGVLISNGQLYWGPWMCGCQLSLYGHIALSPQATDDSEKQEATPQLVSTGISDVKPLAADAADWTSYRGGNARNDLSAVKIPSAVKLDWTTDITLSDLPTAPVVAGGFVFVADRTGTVHAFDRSGKRVWKSYTAGPIYYPPAVADGRLFVGSADGRVYAFEAVTGKFLWSYRVAPQERWIPVFGRLVSTWPVSGGVVEQDGVIYAAAGIAHFDATYVVALNAKTGGLVTKNDTSGVIAEQVNNGISLQGNLTIVDNELRFLAGGVYETARYDLKTLKCLNAPKVQVSSQFRTAFYPYYPTYGKYVSLDYSCSDGCSLIHDASYEGSLFSNLALEEPLPPGVPKTKKEASRWFRRRGKAGPKNLWQDKANRRFTSFVVNDQTLMATGHPDQSPEKSFLVAINIKDGSDQWIRDLPADAVKGGMSIGADGRVYISLENGKLVSFKSE